MKGKNFSIRKLTLPLLLICVIGFLCLHFYPGLASAKDLASIIQEAKANYSSLEKEVKDMTMSGETKMVTPEGEMLATTKIFKKREKIRTETSMRIPETAEAPKGMGEMVTIIIYDGKDYWMISSFMGKKKLSSEEEKQYQTEKNWWDWISEKAEVVGEEKVSGRECYVIRIKEENAPTTQMWLDKKTLILVKVEAEWQKGKPVIMLFSDFRKIKGDWEIPYKTEVFEGAKLVSTTIIKSVEMNKGLSDDLFNPDKAEVPGPVMPSI